MVLIAVVVAVVWQRWWWWSTCDNGRVLRLLLKGDDESRVISLERERERESW
ncbi:hypothetical protein Hanom_Chr15g01376831 [Helianthus anomalus]